MEFEVLVNLLSGNIMGESEKHKTLLCQNVAFIDQTYTKLPINMDVDSDCSTCLFRRKFIGPSRTFSELDLQTWHYVYIAKLTELNSL